MTVQIDFWQKRTLFLYKYLQLIHFYIYTNYNIHTTRKIPSTLLTLFLVSRCLLPSSDTTTFSITFSTKTTSRQPFFHKTRITRDTVVPKHFVIVIVDSSRLKIRVGTVFHRNTRTSHRSRYFPSETTDETQRRSRLCVTSFIPVISKCTLDGSSMIRWSWQHKNKSYKSNFCRRIPWL